MDSRFRLPSIRRIGWPGVLVSLTLFLLVCPLASAQTPAEGSTIAVLAPASDLSSLTGQRIAGIDIVQQGELWRYPVTVRSIHVGDSFNPAESRRAAREIMSSGQFSDISIQAIAGQRGLILRFVLTPRRVVAVLRLVGAAFDEDDVWRDLRLEVGSELTEAALPRIRDGVTDFHVRRGYPHASVRIETHDTDNPLHVVLIAEVSPGKPTRFAARQIIVLPHGQPELEEIVDAYSSTRNDRVDEVQLQDADRRLEEQLRARAYPKARVSHRVTTSQGRYYLYAYVSAGPKLRLRFEGNHLFDSDQLSEAIDYEKETDRSTANFALKVQAFYRSMGLLDATVDVEERGADDDPIRELVFRIREGNVVRATRRSFPCLTGSRSDSELVSEIDSFLNEELPGGGFFVPVDPVAHNQATGPSSADLSRLRPMQLDPSGTYVSTVYDKAVKHIQDLYRSEGYLSATVGPVRILRRSCDRRSPPGQCLVKPIPQPEYACRYDSRGLPVEEPAPRTQSCQPDVARGISCDSTLEIQIPIKLGPQTTLYDISFEGNRSLTEAQLARLAELKISSPASNLDLEQARTRLLDAYRERGFAYAEVRAVLDLSPDHTRARARFTISESEQVIVDRFVVQGATRTSEALILKRMALVPGEPYRRSLVRKSEERIATLGTFSTVTVSLQDPHVPSKRKAVLVLVMERMPQYLDVRPGFSTGQGFRAQFEYGHRNIAGEAIQLTFRIRLGFLPDMFILDPAVRQNLSGLPVSQRMERINSASLLFPEVGLGPLISLGVDGIDVRSNARDFGLTKDAFSSALNFRPIRGLTSSLGVSLERNDVAVFNGGTVDEYLAREGVTADLGRLLRVPDGLTYAVAQRATCSWDRRDSPFGATRGSLVGGAIEHVRAFPASDNPNTQLSDFLRTSGTVAGYVRLSRRGLAIAASIRGGYVYQLMSNSKTYPDRLFFLGGVDSLRGFLQDALVPQDIADRIIADTKRASSDSTLTVKQVAIRGGDIFINPRTELRVPLTELFSTALFVDAGNVWVEPRNFAPFVLRYAAGTGLRLTTPIGPIALDYGINLRRRSWEDFGAFHFSIGLF